MDTVTALDVGGTHVTAARVKTSARALERPAQRRPLDSAGTAKEIVAALCAAVDDVAEPHAALGVAMPDPFDYAAGIGRFRDVGKFDQLYGVDLRAAIFAGVQSSPRRISFVNDAAAFTIGEWVTGATGEARRCFGMTLGTGVGSGFLVDGRVISDGDGLPRNGRIHNLHLDGVPLEDLVSRRAIRRWYAEATGDDTTDVREIANRARAHDGDARRVLDRAFNALGLMLAPVLATFVPDVVVVGGSMSASWDLFEPSFRRGLGALPSSNDMTIVVARDTERAALVGAAFHAVDE